ncbi:hypothetical protein GCM10023205_10820 [Yinghuangia aomiensis]|uniref:Uncharacterized protein n=1 Tax=Yinghuangia aomiensis TaxID=676205 RepID=A0ABP9GRT3_9ACTN
MATRRTKADASPGSAAEVGEADGVTADEDGTVRKRPVARRWLRRIARGTGAAVLMSLVAVGLADNAVAVNPGLDQVTGHFRGMDRIVHFVRDGRQQPHTPRHPGTPGKPKAPGKGGKSNGKTSGKPGGKSGGANTDPGKADGHGRPTDGPSAPAAARV